MTFIVRLCEKENMARVIRLKLLLYQRSLLRVDSKSAEDGQRTWTLLIICMIVPGDIKIKDVCISFLRE